MSDYENNQAVRRHVVENVTLICDNDWRTFTRLTAVAADAVASDMGTGVGREEYEAMLRGRGGNGYSREDYAYAVGRAVRYELESIIEELQDSTPRLIHSLLIDVLDLADSAQADMFGDHYLPKDADDIPWPDDND